MSESNNKETEKKRVKRIVKIFLGGLIIIFTLIYVSSIQNWDVKPIVVKSVTWIDPNSIEMVIDNSNDFEIYGTVSVDADNGFEYAKRDKYIQIVRGESVVRVTDFNIDTSTKRQGNMVITAAYFTRRTSGTNSKTVNKEFNKELLRKVIDLPYVDIRLQSSTSSMVLTDTNQYLTLTNMGNVPESFDVKTQPSNYMGITTAGTGWITLMPNKQITLPLSAQSGSERSESGTSVIEVKIFGSYRESVNYGKVVASTSIRWTNK